MEFENDFSLHPIKTSMPVLRDSESTEEVVIGVSTKRKLLRRTVPREKEEVPIRESVAVVLFEVVFIGQV